MTNNEEETGFQISPSTGKAFAGKSVKNFYSIDKESQNSHVLFFRLRNNMPANDNTSLPTKEFQRK